MVYRLEMLLPASRPSTMHRLKVPLPHLRCAQRGTHHASGPRRAKAFTASVLDNAGKLAQALCTAMKAALSTKTASLAVWCAPRAWHRPARALRTPSNYASYANRSMPPLQRQRAAAATATGGRATARGPRRWLCCFVSMIDSHAESWRESTVAFGSH
jgi:hypothetical protein